MKTYFVFSFFIFILLCTSSGRAQEIQVPLDHEGKVEVIDSDLEKKLGMFTTYEGFREARLYQLSDTSFVLEITYQPGDRTMKVRLPLSAAAVKELRENVTLKVAQQAPEARLNHEGRTWMMVGASALSLGFYGWAVPVVLEVEDAKIAVALYMLTSGAGFFAPLGATNNIDVTDANSILFWYGGTRGILHGVFLNTLVAGEDATARGAITFGMLGSIGESIAGFSVASRMSAGKASTITVCGDFGLGLALGTCGLFDFFDAGQERAMAATVLLGSAGGIIGADFLTSDQLYTRGNAFILEAAGLLGAYVPIAALDLFGVEGGKTYTAMSMAGNVAGVALAHGLLLQGKDFTTGQGILIQLGTLGGGLTGAGLAYLFSPGSADGTLFLTSSAIGGIAGFAVTYGLFSDQAQRAASSSSWNLNLFPAGLLTTRFTKNGPASISRFPFLSIEYRF